MPGGQAARKLGQVHKTQDGRQGRGIKSHLWANVRTRSLAGSLVQDEVAAAIRRMRRSRACDCYVRNRSRRLLVSSCSQARKRRPERPCCQCTSGDSERWHLACHLRSGGSSKSSISSSSPLALFVCFCFCAGNRPLFLCLRFSIGCTLRFISPPIARRSLPPLLLPTRMLVLLLVRAAR